LAKPNEVGFVDRVYVNTGAEGYQFCKVRVRSVCRPIIGDKFAARHGQKGTISMTYPQEDMPSTADGVTPDIIISPWAFPKRMTIGYFMECVASKIGLAKGVEIDGTPFMGYDKMELGEILQNVCGMHHSGTQILYNGMTGEQIQVNIFMGPIYYYRLKHLVSAKIHCRTTGPTTILTRQPTEGRARAGGLRIGEMERDALLSHGITGFLKEKMYDLSDKYYVVTCRQCGSMAVANPTRNLFQCRICPPGRSSSFSKIMIPYSCKLFWQELYAMTLSARVFV
jgi:DNA-directed RNA polymerase II subunit RPB2